MMLKLQVEELSDPEDRFVLEECLATGICGKVYAARDTEDKRKVAIKMWKINRENFLYIQEEYRVLQEFSSHPNIPDFYGIFRKVGDHEDDVWFVMELCEGGSVLDLVNGLLNKNRRISEEHIAFILKETIKALVHLHEHRVMHRDIKANNILLTKDGEVKLVDFGFARHLSSTFGKSDTCLGSPCWMAPEVVISTPEDADSGYGNRADVWALGITAIELGDGKAPFADMHPTRAMFQVVRNPPPTLYRPANWTETFNDFVNECLVKNPEHRPFIMEILEHPFLEQVPENNYYLSQEIKSLLTDIEKEKNYKPNETLVITNFYKQSREEEMQRMYVEDLAAMEKINEETVLHELHARMKMGQFHTFIGNILLVLNPNEKQEIYGEQYHKKYMCKSRSDNAPHIYAMADSAYQDALHQIIPQNIVLGGESGSGKTTNFMHLLDHLLYISRNDNINSTRIKDAMKLIHAFTHASTPYNDYSTRCVIKTEVTFGSTGKVSGAIFSMHQLEKWRVSSIEMSQSNYHMLYYFYDGLEAQCELAKYYLQTGRKYRYLRIGDDSTSKTKPRANPQINVKKWDKLNQIYTMFEFDPGQIDMINKVLAATLIIGDVRFRQSEQGVAEIENEDVASDVATLLESDDKKLSWSLTNYCLIKKGAAVRRRHNCDEARDARDVFANTMYNRIVDYVISFINHKLSYGRIIFGEKYSVRLLDIFGFECFKENHLTQLFINCLNEQLHYHFVQRVFTWEAMEMNEEDLPYTPLHYYDNKSTLDEILGKPDGLLMLIDDASRMANTGEYIIDYLQTPARNHINILGPMEFSISHYTGKVSYNAREMPDRNRDFLPPEVIETLRLSKNKYIKSLFTGKLTRTGNLYTSFDVSLPRSKSKFKLSSSSDEDNLKGGSQEPQFSQIKKMRTTVATFRGLCLDLLKELSVGGSVGGTHFVRCLRSDLEGNPRGFLAEIVKQQLRAMAVVDTVKARQKGFPHRIPFSEFLRRYKFLAFDFDENVEVSKDNCRLLLVRLKMEGWMIGKTKVFLKYYNEEYLSRLYETQVKKIIKIQSMMRGFLAKLKLKKKANGGNAISYPKSQEDLEEDKAARVLQKAYRGVASRKAYGPLVSTPVEKLDATTCKFIRFYCAKWKAKTIFQVLLQYRAARYQDLFNFSQQVHLFNQQVVCSLQKYNNNIGLDLVDRHAQPVGWLGEMKPSVLKMPFKLIDIPFFDTSYMCDPLSNPGVALDKEEDWDAPFRWRDNVSTKITNSINETKISIAKPYSANIKAQSSLHKPTEHLINLPYCRDPEETIRRVSTMSVDPEYSQPKQSHSDVYRKNKNHPPPPPSSNFSSTNSIKQKHSNNPMNSYPCNFSNKEKSKDYNSNYSKSRSYASSKSNSDNTTNPIAELQTIGRKNAMECNQEDDPPFNFQAMLRKTNTNRESIKRTVDTIRNVSIKNRIDNLVYDSRNSSFRKKKSFENQVNGQRQTLQLAPGIYMEGVVADL